MKIRTRTKAGALVALSVAGLLTLTACGSSDSLTGADAGQSGSASAGPGYPTTDITKTVKEDKTLHDQLPDAIKTAGKLSVGYTQSPGVSFLPQGGQDANGKDIGLETDILDAVAKKLGVTVDWQSATFAAIIPGVGSKYDLGEGNFAVLAPRLQTVDQVTYLIDGQSILARDGVSIDSISALTDLCGLKIITGTGTSFQAILQGAATACKTAGKPDWTATFVDDQAAGIQSLISGQEDAYFGPTTSVAYIAQHTKGVKNLGEISWTNVGYAVPKGSPLGPVIADAVNALIKDGSYGKIFKKWNVENDAQKQSQVVTSADTSNTSLVGAQTTKR